MRAINFIDRTWSKIHHIIQYILKPYPPECFNMPVVKYIKDSLNLSVNNQNDPVNLYVHPFSLILFLFKKFIPIPIKRYRITQKKQ